MAVVRPPPAMARVAACGQDLIRRVVAVLRGPEPPPAAVEQPRDLGAEDAARARVAVGDVDAGDLVVPVVLEARWPSSAESIVADGSRPSASHRSDDALAGWHDARLRALLDRFEHHGL